MAKTKKSKGSGAYIFAGILIAIIYVINTFLDAKADELVDIFSRGTDKEKKTVTEVLTDIDPTRQSTYEKINE